jgi:hypothetical protein
VSKKKKEGRTRWRSIEQQKEKTKERNNQMTWLLVLSPVSISFLAKNCSRVHIVQGSIGFPFFLFLSGFSSTFVMIFARQWETGTDPIPSISLVGISDFAGRIYSLIERIYN